MVTYPTLSQVEQASKYQLGWWLRFLPSPAAGYEGTDEFNHKLSEEVGIMNRIYDRFYNKLGGWNPALSKQVGWG